MVAAASASSLVLPAAAAYSSLSCAVFSLVPLLSQHTRHFRFYYFFGAVFRWNPDSGSGAVVVPSAAEAVNYRAEETAVVPRAG